MAMIYYMKEHKAKSTKVKGSLGKVQGKPGTDLQKFAPVHSHKTNLILQATNCAKCEISIGKAR